MNLALYGKGGGRWAMTERGPTALQRDADHLVIGPSALRREGDSLVAEIAEICTPLPRRLRGRLRITPELTTTARFDLDPAGRHSWWPAAPRARVEVTMRDPDTRWQGSGYLDANAGSVPLESDFRRWDWSRAHLRRGAVLLYDSTMRDGARRTRALRVAEDGQIEELPPPSDAPLPTTLWRVTRGTQVDAGFRPTLLRNLEDTPFYARAVVKTRLCGEQVTALHESLDLDRFRHPVVQLMLPFRMPRRRG